MLQRLKKNYFLLISIFLIIYFFFNLLSGERGLISYYEKKQILNDLKIKELSLIKQINDLDFKNSLLSDNLDLDYIETLIRERFLFGKKNEKIYIIKKNDTKNQTQTP
ncbi:FtsB family cell division protein [Candidatus Pelagibacter sp.]|uniref:FtsB family cell division protein n=1 Tax=Candidatus Pelagibacter sp. TaxID=2024849 RepID=UPI003F82766D